MGKNAIRLALGVTRLYHNINRTLLAQGKETL